MTARRRLLAALAVVSLIASLAVVVGAAREPTPQPVSVRADALARELRCPVCGGETVAESQSDVAAAMRVEITDQLSRGRSPAQVRDWFAQRYGSDVLLRPGTDGAGLLVWLLPGLALGAGVLVVARASGVDGRRRGPAVAVAVAAACAVTAPALLTDEHAGPPLAGAESGSDRLAGLRAAASAGDATSWVEVGQALAAENRHVEAVEAYQAAVEAGVAPDAVRLPLGLSLVRSGRPDDAVPLLRRVVADRPDEPDALLVLAAALRDSAPDEARAVLRRFLDLAPDHAGAPGVRRALGEER